MSALRERKTADEAPKAAEGAVLPNINDSSNSKSTDPPQRKKSDDSNDSHRDIEMNDERNFSWISKKISPKWMWHLNSIVFLNTQLMINSLLIAPQKLFCSLIPGQRGISLFDKWCRLWRMYACSQAPFIWFWMLGLKVDVTGETGVFEGPKKDDAEESTKKTKNPNTDPIDLESDCVVILMNHPSETDWLYIFALLMEEYPLIRYHKGISKDFSNFPVLGWEPYYGRYIFLSRNNKEHDLKQISDSIDYEKNINKKPTHIFLFPEGTNLSTKSRDRSKKFAEKINCEPAKSWEHVIMPRATGFIQVVKSLEQHYGADKVKVVDTTLRFDGTKAEITGYNGGIWSWKHMLKKADKPSRVYMNLKRLDLSEWYAAESSPKSKDNKENSEELSPKDKVLEKILLETFQRKEDILKNKGAEFPRENARPLKMRQGSLAYFWRFYSLFLMNVFWIALFFRDRFLWSVLILLFNITLTIGMDKQMYDRFLILATTSILKMYYTSDRERYLLFEGIYFGFNPVWINMLANVSVTAYGLYKTFRILFPKTKHD